MPAKQTRRRLDTREKLSVGAALLVVVACAAYLSSYARARSRWWWHPPVQVRRQMVAPPVQAPQVRRPYGEAGYRAVKPPPPPPTPAAPRREVPRRTFDRAAQVTKNTRAQAVQAVPDDYIAEAARQAQLQVLARLEDPTMATSSGIFPRYRGADLGGWWYSVSGHVDTVRTPNTPGPPLPARPGEIHGLMVRQRWGV